MQDHFTEDELSNIEALLLSSKEQNVAIALEIIQNTTLHPILESAVALLSFIDVSSYLPVEIQDQLHQLFKALPERSKQFYEKEFILLRYLNLFSNAVPEERIQGDIDSFQQHYSTYFDQRPYLHASFVLLGYFFKEKGLDVFAEQIYLLCIRWGSKDEKIFFNQALLEEYKNNDHQAAIPYYQQLLQLNPTHYTAHSNIGLMYQEVGQTNRAIHHFQQAIQLRPHHTRALNNLAYIYWKDKNKYKEASALYEQVLQLNPHYNYALANYAALLIEQDKTQLKRAEKMLRKAIDIDPTFDYPWKILGHLMLAKTPPKKKAALNAYKKAHQYDPDDEETLAALHSLHYKK